LPALEAILEGADLALVATYKSSFATKVDTCPFPLPKEWGPREAAMLVGFFASQTMALEEYKQILGN